MRGGGVTKLMGGGFKSSFIHTKKEGGGLAAEIV